MRFVFSVVFIAAVFCAPSRAEIPAERLAAAIAQARSRVEEFREIRVLAEKQGVRVWLFGGTAATFRVECLF
jgi:hypothetical protein